MKHKLLVFLNWVRGLRSKNPPPQPVFEIGLRPESDVEMGSVVKVIDRTTGSKSEIPGFKDPADLELDLSQVYPREVVLLDDRPDGGEG